MTLLISPSPRIADMMQRIMDDSDTREALGRKDEAAFDEVFRLYSGACLGLARKILRSDSRAHDVVQTVFIALFTKPERFDPTRGTLRSFLLTQTHSRSIDLIRSEKARSLREQKQGTLEMTRQINVADSIEDEIIKLQLSESMNKALSMLSVDERDAIVLSYYKGLTYREVATHLDQPEGTVKSRIRAGMSKLKMYLRDEIPEEVNS